MAHAGMPGVEQVHATAIPLMLFTVLNKHTHYCQLPTQAAENDIICSLAVTAPPTSPWC